MQVNMTSAQPFSAQQLRAAVTPASVEPQAAGDTFIQSSFGDKVKQTAIIGGVGLVGAALGAYAGLGTGVLAGLAGTVAGASGGLTLAAGTSQDLKVGALIGGLTGTLVGATMSHPAAAVVLGIAGATIPVGLILGAMSGAE